MDDVEDLHAVRHMNDWGFLLMWGLAEEYFALAPLTVLTHQTGDDALLFLVSGGIKLLELGLEALHLGEIRAVLVQSVVVLRIDIRAFADQILNSRVVANLRHGIDVAGLVVF